MWIYSSVEEAFEFCLRSFADKLNTLPKSTRRNVKLTKFAFGTPWLYRIYYINIDLRHQYGLSVAASQTFLLAKRPQRRGAARNSCFAGYRRLLFLASATMLWKNKLIKDVFNVIGHFHDNVFLPLRTGIQIRFSLEFQFRNPSDV